MTLASLWRDPAALNAIRWAVARSPYDVMYWIGAVIITAAVTLRR